MGAFRRATGNRINHFNPASRSSVDDVAKELGFSIVVTKRFKGKWNECRDFHAHKPGADPVWLDSPQKGERPNWEAMEAAMYEAVGSRSPR